METSPTESPAIKGLTTEGRFDKFCHFIFPPTSLVGATEYAKAASENFTKDFIIQSFKDVLSKEDLSRSLRLGIIRALREYEGHTSIKILMSQLSHNDQDIYNEVIDSLLICARTNQLDEKELEIVANEIQKTAKKVYAMNECKKLLPEDENQILMFDHLKSHR